MKGKMSQTKRKTMDTDSKWIIVRVDGKIAAISTDYRLLAEISARLAAGSGPDKTGKLKTPLIYGEISAVAVAFEEVWKLRKTVEWDDLMLFGTEFQKKTWRRLWDLIHTDDKSPERDTDPDHQTRLISYSDFAELCDNRAGVRAIAHAVGLNPLPVVIPCHLIVPKEAIDRIEDIRRKAESTIFRGEDLCTSAILEDPAIDFGEYALGKELKRRLIQMDMQ